jgi:Ribonuclease G/E
LRIVAEETIGETRAAVIDGDRAVELHVERWRERGLRAQRGEVYRARVRSIEKSLNGAFCDIGRGPDGFLPFGKAGRPDGLHEGAAIGVQINRESFQEKGPSLVLFDVEAGDAPEAVVEAQPLAERLSMTFDAPVRTPRDADIDLDELFEAALDPVVPLQGGGRLIIEPVTAMTVIDVDAAGRKAQSGGAKFALDLNRIAAREAARQIRLRGIGGVVAIDFLPLKKKADQNLLAQTLSGAFRNDPAKVDIAPASRFAIVELARQRLGRALHEQVWQSFQSPSAESLALDLLRVCGREARSRRASSMTVKAHPVVHEWMSADKIAWRDSWQKLFGFALNLELDPGLSASKPFVIDR